MHFSSVLPSERTWAVPNLVTYWCVGCCVFVLVWSCVKNFYTIVNYFSTLLNYFYF